MLVRLAGLLVGVCVGGLFVTGAAWADGAVYGMTNVLGNNEVVVYQRAADGRLTFTQRIATGGGGSGVQLDPTDSLGSQGALVVDGAHRRLFAVNTETLAEDPRDNNDVGDCQQGTISSFAIAPSGRLRLETRRPSGGLFPASLAVRGGLLYVLNAGGPGLNPACGIAPNITGFRVRRSAQLTRLPGSTRAIDPGFSPGSALNCDPGGGPFPTAEFQCGLNPPAFPRSPGQIGFVPGSGALVVSVKGPNKLLVFPVGRDGRTRAPRITQVGGPNQPTPFGFAFTKRARTKHTRLIVTEPFGATPTIPAVPASSVSSWAIRRDGRLALVGTSVPNGQGTACWIAIDSTGAYAYIGNNATSNISSYRIGSSGELTLLQPVAGAANLPNDLAAVRDRGQGYLYALNSGDGTVGAYRIADDGSLSSLGAAGGLPVDAGAQGLAAF